MPQNNVTMFPPTNWQRQCAILERLLFEAEMVAAQQDDVRLNALDASDAKISELGQAVTLLQSQNQELIKQQAEAAVAHQTELTTSRTARDDAVARTEELIGEQSKSANAQKANNIKLRWWCRGLLALLPVTAFVTFRYHAAIQALFSF